MCVRSSKTFYGSFNLDMDRSPGFGSTNTNSTPYSDLVSLRLRGFWPLNLAGISNSPDRSTKSTPSARRPLTVCKHKVSGSLSLPSRGPFHLSFTVLCAIGHWVVFSLTEWSPLIPTRFLVSRGTLDSAMLVLISDTRLSRSFAGLPRPFSYQFQINYAVLTPKNKFLGLGSFPFARRYLGNRCFFLFLLLLRCFSSEGFLHMAMYLPCSDTVLPYRVSPFGYLRVYGYLLLTAAFRSLSRPSSAPDAKSFSLRSL